MQIYIVTVHSTAKLFSGFPFISAAAQTGVLKRVCLHVASPGSLQDKDFVIEPVARQCHIDAEPGFCVGALHNL